MTVSPRGAVVIENATHLFRLGVDRNVMQAEIGVHEHAVSRIDRDAFIAIQQMIDRSDERWVVDDVRNPFRDPRDTPPVRAQPATSPGLTRMCCSTRMAPSERPIRRASAESTLSWA